MKRVGRREFTKTVAAIAAAAPLLAGVEGALPTSQVPGTGTKSPSALLTAEQQAKLGEAIERRDAQLATLHARALPYDLEPASVFRVRVAPRAGRKP